MDAAQHQHLPPPLIAASIRARLPVADPEPLLALYGARMADCGPCIEQRGRAVLEGDPGLLSAAVILAFWLAHHPGQPWGLPGQISLTEPTMRVWRLLQENTEDPALAVAEIALADRHAREQLLADALNLMAGASVPVDLGGTAGAGGFPFEPDWAVAPGEMLKEWMCEELARHCTLEPGHIEQLCAGAAGLTEDVARQLEQATGIPARLWLRMEENYRAALARKQD